MVIFNELYGKKGKKNERGQNFIPFTTVPIFDRMEAIIKHNISKYGDTIWMVSYIKQLPFI